MRSLRRAAWVAALLLTVPAVAAETPGVTDTEIKLGNHTSYSGSYAVYGVIQRTMKAYFDMINEQGGIYGRKIDFISEDNGGDPQKALQTIKKQVERDGIFATVGNCTDTHLAVYRYLRQKGVPDLWIANFATVYTQPPYHTTFGFVPTAESEGAYFGDFIAKKWPGKTVGILYPDIADGQWELEAFKKAAGDRIKIVAQEVHMKGDPVSKAEVLNLKKAGAEVIYSCANMSRTPAAIKFAHEQGYDPQWVLSIHNTPKAIFDLAGKNTMEGAITWHYAYTDSDLDVPAVRKHFEFMKARLPNDKPSMTSLAGQVLAELTVETLRRAGKTPTRESLVQAAESFKDWKCSICRVPNSTGPDKHIFNTSFFLLKAHDGKWVPYKN